MAQLKLGLGIEEQRKSRKRPPPPIERRLHIALADLIKKTIACGWRFTHLPMGEYRTKRTAALLERMGVTPGWPDFMFVGPHGFVFWLELKRKGSGRLSAAQEDMRMHLMRAGHGYLVTDSFDDAVAVLKDYTIIPRGVRVQ